VQALVTVTTLALASHHAPLRRPYKVVNKDNKPYVQVTTNNEVKTFSPEEVSAMLLSYLRSTAEVGCYTAPRSKALADTSTFASGYISPSTHF